METTNQNYPLWKKIRDFSLDEPEANFKFSDKLAKEQGWSKFYTLRVIEEYKKFIFLICASGNSCSPSEDVDQVWHMHLVYTKSYWVQFCRETLGRDIHHTPSKGGKTETANFKFQYEETKTLYQNYFGESAPEDVWPSTEKRFQFYFRRVDLREYVLIPKLQISKFVKTGAFSFLGFSSLACGGSDSGFGNFLLGLTLVFGFIQVVGLLFASSDDEATVRRRELNQSAYNVGDIVHISSSADVSSVEVASGDVGGGCGGDAGGGCGGGCGGCGGCGG